MNIDTDLLLLTNKYLRVTILHYQIFFQIYQKYMYTDLHSPDSKFFLMQIMSFLYVLFGFYFGGR